MSGKIHYVFIALVLVVSVIILCINISSPFEKAWETQASFHGLGARNYVHYGLSATRLGIVYGPQGLEESEIKQYYHPNHPPLLHLLCALAILIFGDNEFSIRFVQILFSIGCGLFIYLIVLKKYGIYPAIGAMFFFLLSPFVLWHGRVTEYHLPDLFFALGMIYFYLLWIDTRKTKYFLLMLLFQVMGCFMNWLTYLVSPLLFLYHLVLRQRKLLLMLIPIAMNFVCFSIFVIHIMILGIEPSFLQKLFFERTAFGGYSYFDLIKVLIQYVPYHAGIAALILVIVCYLRWYLRRPLDWGRFWLLCIFLGLGLLWNFIFVQLCCVHSYWAVFPFMPFISICAGLGLYELWCGRMFACVACILLIVAFIIQSAVYLYYRHTQTSWYPIERSFVKLVKENLASEKVIATSLTETLSTQHIYYYVPAIIYFNVQSIEDLQEKLNSKYSPSVYITSTKELFSEKIMRLGENTCQRFGVLTAKDSQFLAELKNRYRYEEIDGYYVFSIAK